MPFNSVEVKVVFWVSTDVTRRPWLCTKQWQNVAQIFFAIVLLTNMAAVRSRGNREKGGPKIHCASGCTLILTQNRRLCVRGNLSDICLRVHHFLLVMHLSLCTNLLLTEREGPTGEYWPEVVAENVRGPIFHCTARAS